MHFSIQGTPVTSKLLLFGGSIIAQHFFRYDEMWMCTGIG